jgi:cobyrinic acid a,c-diamide synthase
MAALVARGCTVQPFKVGPDFIDPTHHTRICGRPSRNLDPYMMGEDGVVSTFAQAATGADIAVIEGVMGLYDGLDGGGLASTAHVARILQAPVILVVNVHGMARSAHALVQGFRLFDPAVRIAGIICNRVGSARHRAAIEPDLAVPSFGWIPRDERLAVKSRHLGLVLAGETAPAAGVADAVAEWCDLDGICAAAAEAPPLAAPRPAGEPVPARVSIGIAMDEAFCFYYQDNIERLRNRGARIVFFSPLRDDVPDVDALYLGGGYPELHMEPLARAPALRGIHRAVGDGMPVYGECGGLLALGRSLTYRGSTFPMCGVLPAEGEVTSRIQGLGYVDACVTRDGAVLPRGLGYRGHEFHYSRITCSADARCAIHLARGKGIADGRDGLYAGSCLGCYTHAWFTDSFADALVTAAERYGRR